MGSISGDHEEAPLMATKKPHKVKAHAPDGWLEVVAGCKVKVAAWCVFGVSVRVHLACSHV